MLASGEKQITDRFFIFNVKLISSYFGKGRITLLLASLWILCVGADYRERREAVKGLLYRKLNHSVYYYLIYFWILGDPRLLPLNLKD